VTPSGALVNIPPRADATIAPRSGDGRTFYRGSGARRVSRATGPEPTPVQVLADLSDMPALRVPAAPATASPANESSGQHAGRQAESRWAALRRMLRVSSIVLGIVALFGAGFVGARTYLRLPNALQPTGTVVVHSRPAGLELLVDGHAHGRTPATLELSAGSHALGVRTTRGVTEVPITVVAGSQLVKRIDARPAPRMARRPATGK